MMGGNLCLFLLGVIIDSKMFLPPPPPPPCLHNLFSLKTFVQNGSNDLTSSGNGKANSDIEDYYCSKTISQVNDYKLVGLHKRQFPFKLYLT